MSGDRRIVRDEDDREALLMQLPEQLDHGRGHLGVEIPGRFVGPDDARLAREGAGNGDALLLPAGQLHRPTV
jgi:hypothetical protein